MAEPVGSLLDELQDEEGVRKLIECPICLEIPLPPIYLCAKGHIVCCFCQSKTYACPLCRSRYSSTRSFVAEGIVEKCNLHCKYQEYGCPVTMKGSDLVRHIRHCDFRPIECCECRGKLINYYEFFDHLVHNHEIGGILDNHGTISYRLSLDHADPLVGSCHWPQHYIKCYGKTFLVRISHHSFFICAWVSLLGPQSETSKYDATVEFRPNLDNDDLKEISISWIGPVNHFREDPKKIVRQARGLSISLETIVETGTVCSDFAEFSFGVHIIQKPLQEEPIDDIRRSVTTVPDSRGITSGSCKETDAGGQTTEDDNLHSHRTRPAAHANDARSCSFRSLEASETRVTNIPSKEGPGTGRTPARRQSAVATTSMLLESRLQMNLPGSDDDQSSDWE